MIRTLANKPHKYTIGAYDGYCVTCHGARNYRMHQPPWWRLLYRNKLYRYRATAL